jgi:hypothetical protein
MVYIWSVLKNNKIIGYVRSESETDALRIAKEKLIKNNDYFFMERVVLGNPIPEDKNYCESCKF